MSDSSDSTPVASEGVEKQEILHCVELSFNAEKHPDTEEQLEGYLWALELPDFERIDAGTFSSVRDDHLLLEPGEIRWRFSFETDTDATNLATQLKELFSEFDVAIHLWSRDVTGYRTAWKQYFKPYRASPRLVVHPPWDVPELPLGERVLIDPGMAFGTGTHETTRLCLRIVDELAADIESIFDVGTGSGILLIGAAKLGVSHLIGVDIDPVAVPEARRNADANDVGCIEFAVGSAGYSEATFDLVIANILPHILQSLREQLVARVDTDGYLLLSGIPWSRRSEITDTFDTAPLRFVRDEQDGEWAALLFERVVAATQ